MIALHRSLPFRSGGTFSLLVGLLLMLCASQVAAKSPPTIAVMPFRDLTGKGKPHIGEAIREVVASDLRNLTGVRLVERGNLDKLLKEMRLQAHLKEVENETAAKLGKVAGATVMVIGAYQEETPFLRLTARFVRVDTSEVIGSAKVDGNIKQFFRLQDRVTAELLRSSGLPDLARKVVDGTDARPDLKTMDALDLYGQAVMAEDDQVKYTLLSSAVAMDQNFSYAAKDLAALEERIAKYQTEQRRLIDEKVVSLRKDLVSTTEPNRIASLTCQLLLLLKNARRYYTLQREARSYLESIPQGAAPGPCFENASSYLLEADLVLRDPNGTIHDGENFMRRAPASMYFESWRRSVTTAIEELRQVEDGKQKVKDRFEQNPQLLSWDLCQVAAIYHANSQYRQAQRLFEACAKIAEKPSVSYLQFLLTADHMLGDFPAMRRHMALLGQVDPAAGRAARVSFGATLPADDKTP